MKASTPKATDVWTPCAEERHHLKCWERKLDLLRDRVGSEARGYQNGALITGRPGTGKTYTVRETLLKLEEAGARSSVYRNARMSPMGLFEELSEYRRPR